MTITFDAISLGGASADEFDWPQNFRLDLVDETQLASLIRAAAPALHHRGNRHYTASWTVARAHADVATAEAFILSHAQEFTEAGTLSFDAALVLDPATVTTQGVYKGSVTFHSYTAVGTLSAA